VLVGAAPLQLQGHELELVEDGGLSHEAILQGRPEKFGVVGVLHCRPSCYRLIAVHSAMASAACEVEGPPITA
jgi:hypothetical protein